MRRKKISLSFLTSCFGNIFTTYFKTHQRLKRIRYPHVYIMLGTTVQLIAAPFIAFLPDGNVSHIGYHFVATWLHMLNGLVLLGVTIFFSYDVIKRKGLEWLYPYAFGKFAEIKDDFKTLFQIRLKVSDLKKVDKETRPFIILEQMQLPRLRPRGLGAVVQGLGLIIQLLLTTLGFFFFVCWLQNLDISWDILAAHRIVAIPFVLFYFGHGGMGILHIFNQHAQQRMKKVREDATGETTGTESCDLPNE